MIGVLLLAAIRGSILLVIAWIATIVLRSKSAALRHSIWNFAIASQLALPIVALVMPQRSLSFGKLGDRAVRVTTGIGVTSTPVNRSVEGTPTQQNSPARVSAGQTSPSTAIAAAPLANDVDAILRFIALLWAVGATLMVTRFVIGTLLVARETSRARLPVDREWILLAGRIQDEMDLRREAVLLRGAKGEVPYTWGIVSPVVCLPADADQWSLDRVRIVLIHELAHVDRYDTFGELIAQLALVIFWFNPLLWLAVRRMRAEREHACDDRVLTRGVKPSTYVEELVNMMKSIGSGAIAPGFGAIAMARRTQFEERMFAVLNERINRSAIGRGRQVGVAAAAIALVLIVASVRPASARPTSSILLPRATQSAGKPRAWEQSDFDELVADCKRDTPKNKPKIGVRYCEVRTVDVSALSGPVEFRGGYVDGVIFTTSGSAGAPRARALVKAEALTPEDARKLAAQVRTYVRDGVLQSEGPGGGRSSLWSVIYEVTLPVGRSVVARTENGPISITDFVGTTDVASVNGPIEVFAAAGDIKGRTENGPLMVELTGRRWEGAGLDLRSQNGPVMLSIPDGYSGHLITGTINGPLDLRYPLTVKRISGRGIDADLGSGGTTVRVTTVNGPADIR